MHCELDDNEYETGRTVSAEQMATINLTRDSFHGKWNYTIYPSQDECDPLTRAQSIGLFRDEPLARARGWLAPVRC